MKAAYDCNHPVDIANEPRHHLVFGNEFVRAFAIEIAPGDRTLCHRHSHDYMLYVAGEGEVVSAARDEEPKRLSYSDGECELLDAGLVHVVENLGDKPFRNVVVELLDAARGLGQGRDPAMVGGDSGVERLLKEDRARIFRAQLESRAQVAFYGPAIIAAPYGVRLTSDMLQGAEIHSHKVCDLAWVPQGPSPATLRAQDPVTLVIFSF